MRYRKSITLMKGVRLNFSKSGASLTVGSRGGSMNFSKNGTYLNTGIPGTGLYDRQRIDSPNFKTSSSYSPELSSRTTEMTVKIHLDDDGVFSLQYEDGTPITDESFIRKIKKTDGYKAKVEKMTRNFIAEKEESTTKFVEIYKHSEKLIEKEEIENKLENLTLKTYRKEKCNYPPPNEDSLKAEVEAAARRNIRSLFGRKKKRQEYFDVEYPKLLEEAKKNYLNSVDEFERNEQEKEKRLNTQYKEEYESQKAFLKGFIDGKSEYVENNIDAFLTSIVLPVDFSVSYEYQENTGNLMVDLDLPEIEDLPKEKASTLASGKIKVKEKTQKELKEEYINCTTGLAFFFASKFFNITIQIKKILISGYTQRLSKKTGNMEDQYVYSIIFDRDSFSKLNIEHITPYLAFENFKNVIDYKASYEMNTIEPLTEIND